MNPQAEMQFQQARQMMRNVMGVNYEKRIGDYKGMLKEMMLMFKLSPMAAVELAIRELEMPNRKQLDEDGWAKLCFLAAYIDMVESSPTQN